MQHGIREFRPRQPLDRQLSSDTLNRILREMESLRITQVVNGSFKKLPGGTEIVVAPQRGGGGTPAITQPWDLIARVDPDADPEDETPPYIISVRPGTLNGILPTNWEIAEQVDGTSLYYAKAIISTDGRSITEVSIDIDATPPIQQEPQLFSIATSIELLFGLFASGQTKRVIGFGSINVEPYLWLTTATEQPAAPGELPWVQYYNLQES